MPAPMLSKNELNEIVLSEIRKREGCEGVNAGYARHYALSKSDLDFAEEDKEQNKRDWKRAQFKAWARLAVSWAADLAPYQSPTYRAISISHKDDVIEDRGTTVIHTIEDLKAQLLLHGVSPDQLGRALLEQEQRLLEDDSDSDDRGK